MTTSFKVLPEEEKLWNRLNDHYKIWPIDYKFKFIVKSELVSEVKSILQLDSLELRPSKNGNYQSITVVQNVSSADEILITYRKVKGIKGIVCL